MKTKYKILALCGKSASGKSSVLDKVCAAAPNVNKIIGCSTRPPREGEVDGKDYFFLTNEQFTEKVLNGDMLEATNFNDWFYGTFVDVLSKDTVNVGVFNPESVMILADDSRIELTVAYILCNDKERLLRQLERETFPDCSEICRRFLADEKDFSKEFIDDYVDAIFANTTSGDFSTVAHNILSILDKKR